MKQQEMLELIQQHHPHIREVEAEKLINRAMDDFCAKTEIVKDSYTFSTVVNQRYYTLDKRIIKVLNVWLGNLKIPRLVGKPVIDDDTSETG